jgi:hypothetical protein
MYRQDENGTKQQANHAAHRTDYLPKGADPDNPPSTLRSYYFRTTPKPIALGAGAVSAFPRYGEVLHITALRVRKDLFEPQMLTRFLLGYSPVQTETARFCDDPVNAHFSAVHVTTLAKVYGYTLKLGLRRVDVPGSDGDAIELMPSWLALKEPSLLTGADARRIEVASTAICPMPKPGGTLAALSPLAAEAWYEVYALAKSDDTTVADGRLDGVTFRTSRWRNPAQMLAGIGFGTTPSVPAGDVELHQAAVLAPAAIDGSDADFEAALDAIALDGWPAAVDPRIVVLWLRHDDAAGPSWKCMGLLVESPEPIDRPGRVHFNALRLVMQPPVDGAFDIRRSDRSRSRMLWLCSTPFEPRTWRQRRPFQPPRLMRPSLVLELVDDATSASLSGSVLLPLAPSFAEEA